MTCPSCGRAAVATGRFCAFCGAPFVDHEAPTMAQAGEGAGTRSVSPAVAGLQASLSPSGSHEGRFAPGALLADRYRIAGLLGRGGMGEVYRADDLVLGQPVALKFLPDAIAAKPDRIARFRAEVRVAREVSHPNVCRVYDIGEIQGHPFLSMEYIDGENLSSLLRRIGRLPYDTAVDMARQLCAGLAAAHDKGVLHRDLKPSNVMIDGRGKVKLADFGLAALAEDSASHVLGGTPAYMAPELFDQKAPSIRSDIYALGLVLYEMFAGKPAFHATSVGEMARLHHESMPTSLSRILTDADPVVDRVIQRCLAKEPAERPVSALAVAAALPGGDPLAAALAAGETPSPQMVAAAGGVGALKPIVGLACFTGVALGLVTAVLLSGRTQAIRYAPTDKAPAILADQAESMIRRLGYTDPPADTAYGFAVTDYVTYLREHDRSTSRWENLRTGQPPGFTFWYRQSPEDLTTDRFFLSGRVRLSEPPHRTPGMAAVMLDLRGRLHQLIIVAPPLGDAAEARPADWAALFREAGFDVARFTTEASKWTPPVYADTRAAWDGVYPDRPDVKIHVEAASSGGRPVFFQIYEPWSTKTLLRPAIGGGEAIRRIILLTAASAVLIGALLLVRRNIRLGRGDQVGAFRLALILFELNVAAGLLGADQSLDPLVLAPLLGLLVAQGLLVGALVWVSYVALEPDLRRRSPHMLISWSRVLAGRFTDPLVGRDVLVGIVAGTGVHLLTQMAYLAPAWFGRPPNLAMPSDAGLPVTMWQLVAQLLHEPATAVLVATSFVLLVFLLYVLLRRRWLVGLVFFSLLMAMAVANNGFGIDLAIRLPALVIMTLVVLRFGLFTFIVMNFVVPLLDHLPLTFDPGVWYAGFSWFTLAVVAGLALYGFRVAVAGRPVFEGGWLKE